MFENVTSKLAEQRIAAWIRTHEIIAKYEKTQNELPVQKALTETAKESR